MHSRIFQVSLEPIAQEDYIEEALYWDHWFLNSVADYVTDSNRDEDIDWLKDCEEGLTFGADDNGEYFIVNSKEQYFEKKFKRFKNAVDSIKSCTLEEFTKDIFTVWELKNAYEDKFGFYVDLNYDVLSFDSFIRACTTDVKYYLGGTLDYHC